VYGRNHIQSVSTQNTWTIVHCTIYRRVHTCLVLYSTTVSSYCWHLFELHL